MAQWLSGQMCSRRSHASQSLPTAQPPAFPDTVDGGASQPTASLDVGPAAGSNNWLQPTSVQVTDTVVAADGDAAQLAVLEVGKWRELAALTRGPVLLTAAAPDATNLMGKKEANQRLKDFRAELQNSGQVIIDLTMQLDQWKPLLLNRQLKAAVLGEGLLAFCVVVVPGNFDHNTGHPRVDYLVVQPNGKGCRLHPDRNNIKTGLIHGELKNWFPLRAIEGAAQPLDEPFLQSTAELGDRSWTDACDTGRRVAAAFLADAPDGKFNVDDFNWKAFVSSQTSNFHAIVGCGIQEAEVQDHIFVFTRVDGSRIGVELQAKNDLKSTYKLLLYEV